MIWLRTAVLALRMLVRHRMRATLAILGIAVAVFLLCAERAMHDPLMAQLRALRPLRQAERSAARAEGSRRAR